MSRACPATTSLTQRYHTAPSFPHFLKIQFNESKMLPGCIICCL